MTRRNVLHSLVYCLIVSILLTGCSSSYYNTPAYEQSRGTALFQSSDDLDAIFDPSKAWPQEHSDLQADPSVIYGSLDNGFRYMLMKNVKPEHRVQMHLFIQAGSMVESDSERGVAHFLEHLEFCGSENFEPGELVKYFQSIGMQFGADANAQTGFYSTIYDIDLPEGDSESLKKGLLVMRDFAAGALIPESEVDRERPVVLAEKRTRDSADFRTFEKVFTFELPDAAVSKRLPIGDETVLSQADRQVLKSFYDAWYRPEKMILILVGDYDTNAASDLIRERFSGITPRAPNRSYPDPGTIGHKGIRTFYHYEPESGSTSVTIEVMTKKIKPPDTIDTQRENLVSSMADHIVNNRISEMLEKPDTPFTGASIDSGNSLQYLQAAEISADCAPENWQKTLAALDQTLRQALDYGFTQSEIDIAKKEFIAQLDKAVLTASTRESQDIAHQIYSSLGSGRVFQSPRQRQSLLTPMIETVTGKELHGALSTDWAPDHRLIIVTGNVNLKDQPTLPKQQILDAYKTSSRKPIEKPSARDMIKFPYLAVPDNIGKIVSHDNITDLGIIRIEFANGVRLNIKKTDFKAGQVLAVVAFGYGRSSEPENKPGLSSLSQKVINLSGLGRLSRDELQKALAGKNTDVLFQADEDHFLLSGQTIPDEIPLLFQLYQAYLTDPGFREDTYTLVMNQFTQDYESLTQSIEGGMPLKGAKFLAGGDTRFGLPEYEIFKNNSLEDVRNWVGPVLAGAPLEVSIAGDLDIDAVIELAAVYMGSLPDRSPIPAPDESRHPKFPVGESLTISMPTKIEKGMVDVAYPTGDYWDIRRTRRLSVLSEILSDRMRIRIRDEMGAAYSLEAYNDPSRTYSGYGVLHAVILNNPDESKKVIQAVKTIANDIVQNGIRAEEFDRALKPVIEKIKEYVKTNTYWLNGVLKGSSRHPEQLDWSRTFQADYTAITVEDVAGLAKQYLNNQAAAVIVIEPEKAPTNDYGAQDAGPK